MKKILVIEDEKNIRNRIVDTLELSEEPYQVFAAQDGREGLEMARREVPDLIISDVMMPEKDGYEVCYDIKTNELTAHIPVVLLTAKSGMDSKLKGLRSGADDYLTKPFSFVVLTARLRALIRRGAPQRPVVLTAGDLSLDPGRRVVHRAGQLVTLTPREFALLAYLLRHKDTVLTKTDILRNVWDSHYDGPDNVVEVYVGYLRRKIGADKITTLRGAGYRLESGEFDSGN